MKIPGTKTLVFGSAGSGKTYSTRTLFDIKGIQPVHLFLEPSMATINSFPKAKWKHIKVVPPELNWDALRKMATLSNTLAVAKGIAPPLYPLPKTMPMEGSCKLAITDISSEMLWA